MPLTDRDPNASGRTSRASNMSAGSRGLQKAHVPGGRSDMLSSAPGIFNMLRTSTELGDIGSLTLYDSSHGPNVPRAPPRRQGASSRMSTGSSQSNTSKRASSHQAWPSASSGPARPSTRDSNVPQYLPDTLSPTMMNFPGSSPLFPRSRSREGHRSLSMTNTSQPTFRLSSNRSFASLRTHEHPQRPRSPYRYPTRLRRPGYRPGSPALSDITGAHPRRPHGNPGYSRHPGYPGHHPRLRTPSDVSVHRDERGHVMMSGPPSRNRSPTFLTNPHPQMPPLGYPHHHMVVEQARMAHRPAKGSISSGSTNHRTDSDAPSSDAPSPPTPKDGTSMEVLVSPSGTRVLIDNQTGVVKEEVTTGPLYYDYSEQFEREPYNEPGPDAVPIAFGHRIKTIVEERGTVDQTPKMVDVSVVQELVGPPASEIEGIAELPASPVARPITRDMILAALEPASTTQDVEVLGASLKGKGSNESGKEEQIVAGQAQEEPAGSSLQPEDTKENRRSILSQAGSSIMDSSTLDFAVRYSIPMVTGGAEAEAVPSTEDGMSDLLNGYQHTETKQEFNAMMEKGSAAEGPAEQQSNHAPKSSDEQSFKSCTDLPEQAYKDSDAKSFKTSKASSEQPCKDSDARSFKTCKDTVTPERAVSMPPLGLPSSKMGSSGPKAKRPVSEIPLSSPLATIQKAPPDSPCESSFSKAHARLRTNSKPSSRHGSTVASISSSVESATQQPPSVPPRDSSSSKEAQRTQAVADFLVRLSRPRRFSRAHPSFGKKQAKDEVTVRPEVNDDVRTPDLSLKQHDAVQKGSASDQPVELVKTPEKVLAKQEVVPEKQIAAGIPSKESASAKEWTPASQSDTPTAPPMHQYSLSTPSPVIAEPSSVYSPEDTSSSKSRVVSSPVAFPKSPEQDRRDSQTTTHLVWNVRKPSNLHAAASVEPRPSQGNGQDETTTDLRLSAYRYPLHYLPDLKEESHEDSSLNTSASNLKNSSFRFPFGGQPGVRASVDDAVLFGQNPSSKPSHRNSTLAQTRGLPSMNFSRMDLIGKLNEALDLRSSRSLDGVPDDAHELAQPGVLRRASAGEIREKYRSFFASLDELEKTGDATQPTTIMDLMPLKRPFSSVQLMEEIDKLTIPSVGGLTQRLSEFLPSLKEYYRLGEVGEFDAEEVIMEHAMEELSEVGGPAPKRSSARLRPMPGSPNMVVVDDAVYEEMTGREREGDGGEDETEEASSDVKDRGATSTGTREKTPLAELEAPSPAVLRTRSLSVGHQGLRQSLESRLSSRRSLRSFGMSSPPTATDTRPWNKEENYPWGPSVDISLPAPTAVRHSPRPGPSRLRNRLSASSELRPPSPAHSPTSPSATAPDDSHRPNNRFNMFSSKQSTNPQPEGFDASGNATAPLRGHVGDQSHGAGERYPFSALAPPTDLHMPGLPQGSFDTSSESSEGGEQLVASKRRRFNMKSRFTTSSRALEAESSRVQEASHSRLTTNSMQDQDGEDRDFTAKKHQSYVGAAGMPNAVYRRKSVIEHIKKWWRHSTKLIRNISKRNRATLSEAQTLAEPRAPASSPVDSQFPVNAEDGVSVGFLHGVNMKLQLEYRNHELEPSHAKAAFDNVKAKLDYSRTRLTLRRARSSSTRTDID